MQKASPHFPHFSVFSTFWFSVNCFFAFFGIFWTVVSQWFRVLVNSHLDTLSFLNFFLNVGVGLSTVASGLLSATFPTLTNTSSSPTDYNLIFLNNFLLGYTLLKILIIIVDSANFTCTTVSLPSQMLTRKVLTMHFAMVGFKKLWIVWRLNYLTY